MVRISFSMLWANKRLWSLFYCDHSLCILLSLECRPQEIPRIVLAWFSEDAAGLALFDDASILHDEDAVGDGADERQIV